jgi:hypothetical protein
MKALHRSVVLSLSLAMLALGAGCAGLPKHVSTAPRMAQPPPGKALINIHRPSNYGGAAFFPIFDGDGKFICDMPGASEFQYVCAPGKHVFIGWADHVSVVEADVAADKVYDIVVDVGMGWVKANIRLIALNKANERRSRVAEFEKREKRVVVLNRNDHVTQYEQRNQKRVAEVKSDFFGGPKSDRVEHLRQDDCR